MKKWNVFFQALRSILAFKVPNRCITGESRYKLEDCWSLQKSKHGKTKVRRIVSRLPVTLTELLSVLRGVMASAKSTKATKAPKGTNGFKVTKALKSVKLPKSKSKSSKDEKDEKVYSTNFRKDQNLPRDRRTIRYME